LIDNGSAEYSFGLEYNITEKILISAGYQYGQFCVSPQYQSDMSHNISNYTLGFGGAYKLTDKIKINAGFLITNYIPYDVELTSPLGTKFTQTYDRKNSVFSIGLDFKF